MNRKYSRSQWLVQTIGNVMRFQVVLQCRPKDKIQKCADRNAEGGVDPEYPLHGVKKPWTCIRNTILTGID
jgi:hypothetical protein